MNEGEVNHEFHIQTSKGAMGWREKGEVFGAILAIFINNLCCFMKPSTRSRRPAAPANKKRKVVIGWKVKTRNSTYKKVKEPWGGGRREKLLEQSLLYL